MDWGLGDTTKRRRTTKINWLLTNCFWRMIELAKQKERTRAKFKSRPTLLYKMIQTKMFNLAAKLEKTHGYVIRDQVFEVILADRIERALGLEKYTVEPNGEYE